MSKLTSVVLCSTLLSLTLAGCSSQKSQTEMNLQLNQVALSEKSVYAKNAAVPNGKQIYKPNRIQLAKRPEQTKRSANLTSETVQPDSKDTKTKKMITAAAQPDSIPVLVNKKNKLPDSYKPGDLIYTDIPFIFKEKSEKRKMRKEAAAAIESLFSAGKEQGIRLLGVSAYRSYEDQVSVFNSYVKKDGFEKAMTYSAVPGTSEHETGLAIDVTGGSGRCPAQDCFGNTKEAGWLQEHAADYGFIVRYPKGKEVITGYKYEPWHLRYVGTQIAKDIMSRGITLEEYYHSEPVTNQ